MYVYMRVYLFIYNVTCTLVCISFATKIW